MANRAEATVCCSTCNSEPSSHDDTQNWYRSYGNENWEFGDDGLMHHRHACINDLPIAEADRKFFWPLGRRPDDHPGLSDLGL
ncbi:histidine kinase [Burkholderia cenocepacia]|uniref:Histidine kinase n=1 Tax=Burkholderia cenocepacia TaxID=95486 RepID=A0AAD0J583_9BURK|nr:histidine kinase [Burkholderia cenocepacia]